MNLILLLVTACFGAQSEATFKPGVVTKHLPDGTHLSLHGAMGYTNSSVEGEANHHYLQYTLGATAGYWFMKHFFIGATTDYRILRQTSEVTFYQGNRGGTRWNMVSPTLGYGCNNWRVLVDAQFLGDHELSYGQDALFKDPIGGRAKFGYDLMGLVTLEAFYEHLVFRKAEFGNAEYRLKEDLGLWQLGLGVSYGL